MKSALGVLKILRIAQSFAVILLLFPAILVLPTASAASTPAIALESLTLQASAAGQQVQARVSVTGPLKTWSVRLVVSPEAMPTRSSLDAPVQPAGINATVNGASVLHDGERTSVSIRASLERLSVGAHPARVELLNGSQVVAHADFYLSPLSGAGKSTPIVWLWPITERPHRGVDGVFFDEELLVALDKGGRLDRLVERGAGEPIVWVIDPALLVAAEDLSKGYTLWDAGKVVEREGSVAAARWLTEIATATANREVIVLPYGDPDLASLSQLRGSEISNYQSAGTEIVARLLDRSPASLRSDVAWPRNGRVSSTLLTDLKRAGYTSFISTSREFANIEGATFTPSARAASINAMTPVISDAVASSWLARPSIVESTRALAEIATISAERPNQARLQVLAPPRSWDPEPASLTYIQEQVRTSLTSYSAALRARAQSRGEIAYSATLFSSPHLDAARSNWKAVSSAESALGVSITSPYLLAVGPLTTALAENTPSGLLAQCAQSSRAFVNHVRVLPGRYTLTAKEQEIPVTVVNEFDQPVTVSVSIRPHAPRITTERAEPIEIPARGRTQVLVPITAVATGLVAADAYLITANGKQYGDGQVLTFDVRSIGPVADWILWGSTALLALAVALRLTRRIRAVRRLRGGQ